LLDWISWGAFIFGAALLFAYLFRSFYKKPKCPICGSGEVEKIPKEWVTTPMSYRGGPTTVTSHYKYRCRKCQNEWEDY
jgi:transposase-like protein